MLEFLLVILALLIILPAPKDKNQEDDPEKPVVAPVKNCPPHKWNYVQIEGQERIRCDLCKRRPGEVAGLE